MAGGGGVAVAVGLTGGPESTVRVRRLGRRRTSDPQNWVTSHVLNATSNRELTKPVLTENKYFRWVMAVTILLNVVQLGLAVEFKGNPWRTVWETMEHVFVAAFVLEMILKIYDNGLNYFRNHWNDLDCFIAVTGVIDTWILRAVMSDSDDSSIPVLSIIRVMRLLRMIKMLRMRRELDVLLEGMIASFQSMFWVGLLLAVAIYSFAIFCTSTIGDPRETASYERWGLDNRKYFGSILRSSLSLFNIVLLNDWSLVVWPVFNAQPYATVFLIIFVILTSCGMLNVIIGVIVERTNEATRRLREEDLENMRKDQMVHAEKLSVIMDVLDTNKDTYLTEQELMAAAENSDFGQTLREGMLNGMNLPLNFEFTDLYLMLDQDSNNQLSPKEFIEGMYRLIYGTEFQHTCMMQLSMAKLMRQFKVMESTFKKEMYRCCDDIMQEIHSLRRQVLLGDLTGIDQSPIRREISSSSCNSKTGGAHLDSSPKRNQSQPPKAHSVPAESTPCEDDMKSGFIPTEFPSFIVGAQLAKERLCVNGVSTRREARRPYAPTSSSHSYSVGSTTSEVKAVEPLTLRPDADNSFASESTTAATSTANRDPEAKEPTQQAQQGENASSNGPSLNGYVKQPFDSDAANCV